MRAAAAGVVASYVHMPVVAGAGRIAAVVGLEAPGVQQLSQVCLCACVCVCRWGLKLQGMQVGACNTSHLGVALVCVFGGGG